MNCLNGQLFCKKHVLAGFGNPLVDIFVVIKNRDILHQFNLKPDGQSEVDSHVIGKILKSLEKSGNDFTKKPGGCVQNTFRIIQALAKQPKFCVFFGGLGGDSDGVFLEAEVTNCGVETRYAIHPDHTTGKVAALIHGDKRTLVAHLGAAEIYELENFNTPENLKILEEVLLVYIEGFFITHSLDVALEVVNICRSKGVIVAFNISGAYVADFHADKLLAVVKLVDIIIGNDSELRSLSRAIGLKDGALIDLAIEVYSFLCDKHTTSRPMQFKISHMTDSEKVLVVTQGKDPVVCVHRDKQVLEFPVPQLDVSVIKDTTGAGDSFAAGFLLAFLQGKTLTECLACGCGIALRVIQQIGVILPEEN